jgi:membrane protein YdbS with pleckstrin-like domain
MSSERRPPKPAGIGAISMLAAVIVLVPGIVVYVLLRAVGLGIGGAGVIALFVMILGMVVYPLVLRRTGWVGPPPARRGPGSRGDGGEGP